MAAKKVVTPELLVDQVRLSDPQISPDGSRVAYVRTPIAKKGERGASEIWMVDAKGAEDRRFTISEGQDSAPRWSPDGGRLAFVSDRAEKDKAQLYVMTTGGGEAICLTRRKAGVSAPSWSPDGRRLAFLAKDEPTEEEEKDTKDKRDAIPDGANLKRDRLYVMDADGSEPALVSPEGEVNVWAYCWSPKGDRIAAVTTPSPLIAERRNPNDLMIIAVAGGKTKKTVKAMNFPTTVDDPRWSPDGRTIAFQASTGRVMTADQIHLLDVASRKWRVGMKRYEGSVQNARWSNGRTLVFTALENVHGAVNALDLRTGTCKPVLAAADRNTGALGDGLSLSEDGRFAVIRSDSQHPAQVHLGRAGARLRPLSSANEELTGCSLRPAEVVSWRSVDGREIFGLQMLPAGGRKPYPMVLIVHGGPATAFADRFMGNWHDWAQLLAATGYAVLMPNPRGSTGRGSEFTDAEVGDIGGMELADDMAGLDRMVEHGIANPKRLAIAGWSHGGYMAAWVITQTNRFKASVMGAGVSNMISDQGTNDIPGFNLDYFYKDFAALYADPSALWERSPLKHVERVKTPTLVLHGENDDRVASSQGREFHRALKSLDVPTEMVIYPREKHGIGEREHQLDVQRRILAWLKKWV